ncbi:MAG: T9SS type A sorting domain-containing protein [Bacteroidetes bacterium]|nr:T9SS type A sorting domain-containing protein [Bacteroidota bacterium]
MKQNYLFFIGFVLFFLKANSQNSEWSWAKSSYSNYASTYSTGGRVVVADADGNLYVAGIFNRTDIGFDTTILKNTGGIVPIDIFIVKYNKNGVVLWAKQIGGTGNYQNEYISDLKIDAQGDLLICGTFSSRSITIGSYKFANNFSNSSDIFIAKMDGDGNVKWAKQIGGSSYQHINELVPDALGNIYVIGSFRSNSIKIGKTTLKNTNAVNQEADGFVAKLDSTGNAIWAKRLGGFSEDYPTAISLGNKGNLYIAGNSYSDSIFIDNFKLYGANMFYANMDTSGKVLSATVPGLGWISDIIIDEKDNKYFSGNYYFDSLRFGGKSLPPFHGSGSYGIFFMAKLDANDKCEWLQSGKSSGVQNRSYIQCTTLDRKGNIYAAGCFTADSLTIGSTTFFNPNGQYNAKDIFIINYNNDGTIGWVKSIQGADNEEVFGICNDADGNIIFTGNYSSAQCTFGKHTLKASNAGGSEVFVAKLSSKYVGINTPDIESQISLFPNPVNEKLNILVSALSGKYEIEVVNILGEIVFHQEENLSAESSFQLDVSQLPAGFYFIQIKNQERSFTSKFIKE